MIIGNTATQVSTSGIGQTAQATIKASARLFNFFSDMIYSDKFVAIWRELVANGMDAQIAAGNLEANIIVTLPTDYTPYAKVRDHGTGMSHDFLMGKFMAYTDASTKENSNDFIGGFGIGSKAPLSYTEQFAIHSYQAGEVGIYSVFKDESGCPAIAFLGRHSTTEPDGVEISFPVEGKDIAAFRAAVYGTLNYFQPLPVLINSAEPLQAPEYSVRTPTWGFKVGAADSRIVQGGIAYPIDAGSVKEIDDLLSFGIDFFVPIGSCSIALSRERLSYDEPTIRILKSLANDIKPDLEKHVEAMFAGYKTRWEAEAAFVRETATGNPQRTRLVNSNARWRRQKLTGRVTVNSPIASKLNVAQVTSSRYSKTGYGSWTEGTNSPSFRALLNNTLHPRDIGTIVIDDGATKPILRLRNYLQTEADLRAGVVIFRPKLLEKVSKVDWARFIISLGRPTNIRMLSEFEPAIVTRSVSVRQEKVRAYLSNSRFDTPSRTSKHMEVDIATVTGYYMLMDSFKVIPGQATNSQLIASGISPDQVFWFNKGDWDKVKSKIKLKPAIDKFNAHAKDYVAKHPHMAKAEAMMVFNAQTSYSYGSSSLNDKIYLELTKLKGINLEGDLLTLKQMWNDVESQINVSDNMMRKLLNIQCKDEYQDIRNVVRNIPNLYKELNTLMVHDRGVSQALVSVYNKLMSN